jgi:hypothetical protein
VGLLLIPAALAVLSFGPWIERRTFVRLAAAEVSRAVVLADGSADVAMSQVAAMAANHGLDLGTVRVGVCGAAPVPLSAGGASACPDPLPRGGSTGGVVTGFPVTATVEVDVPVVVLPWGGGSGGPATVGGVVTSWTHISTTDLYRSIGS